jgi:integrase
LQLSFISRIKERTGVADGTQLSQARHTRDFACWVLRTTTQVTVVDRRTGARSNRPTDRWDVRGKADGVQFSKRFERAGLAQVWKEQLDRGFANGLPFDLRSRRFVAPEGPVAPRPALPATVFAITESFYWANPDWEPKTKILAAAAFNRARRWLLNPDAILVDADLVLSIPQAFDLAQACARLGSWGAIVECYVLVMAMCGLRPNEAVGRAWEDIELPADGGPGWLVARRSRRRVASRWLDSEEDPEWGPLKDRDLAESRRVPIDKILVAKLIDHRERCGNGPSGLVFHHNGHPFDLSTFDRDVWRPARQALFPPRPDLPAGDPRQPKLSRLRRHDLRHAACSWWLRSGVDATVCQRWSGHKTLSVFLDVYQGVAPGRKDEGITLLERSLAEPVTSPVD